MAPDPAFQVTHSRVRRVSFESVARNRIHRHSYFEPCIVISGTGEFLHGPEQFPLGPGDLFLADPGQFHEIRSLESRDLCLYFVAFQIVPGGPDQNRGTGILISQSLTSSFLARHRNHLSGQSDAIPLFQYLFEMTTRDDGLELSPHYRDASLLLLRHLMSALSSSAELSADDYSDGQRKARVQAEIEKRLHQPFRVRELARACGMSERTLRRRWQTWSGWSLPEEINRRRIERACQLLMLPDLAIAEIGYQVGFSSPARFSRQFRSLKGVSARDYRKRLVAGAANAMSGSNEHMTEFLKN